jgi:hypothetical protein
MSVVAVSGTAGSKDNLDHGVMRDIFSEFGPCLVTGQENRLEALQPGSIENFGTVFIDQVHKFTGRHASAAHATSPCR